MFKKALTAFILPCLFLLSSSDAGSANPIAEKQKIPDNLNETSGILQKMIVESGTATMELDLNRLNGISAAPQKQEQLRFDIAANSFFSILVFNDLLRGPEQGSMALIPQGSSPAGVNNVPVALGASLKQLTIEKLPSGEQFDLAVRDAKTGFIFFNIEGHQYNYDAWAELLTVSGGRLAMSRDLANALGRPSDFGAVVGEISLGAAMQPVEIKELVNGELKGVTMPPLHSVSSALAPTATHGPDVIVGTCRTWNNREAPEPRWASRWQRLLVTTATSHWIGSNCQILIIRSFHRIYIEWPAAQTIPSALNRSVSPG